MRNKNFMKFYAFLPKNKFAPLKVKLKVLNACVLSSILYNCETWGHGSIQSMELIYRRILKKILELNITSVNDFIYVELGCVPLECLVKKRQFIFWQKVSTMNINDPLRKIINYARSKNLYFIKYTLYCDHKDFKNF